MITFPLPHSAQGKLRSASTRKLKRKKEKKRGIFHNCIRFETEESVFFFQSVSVPFVNLIAGIPFQPEDLFISAFEAF